MSVSVQTVGPIAQPKHLLLPDTNANVVFTASSAYAHDVVGIIIVNADSSARVVAIHRNDGTSDHLIWRESVAANTTVKNALEAPIRLYSKNATETIKATAALGNVVTVTVVAVDRVPIVARNDPTGVSARG